MHAAILPAGATHSYFGRLAASGRAKGPGQPIEPSEWTRTQRLARSYLPLLKRIDGGQRYAFRLTANPTRALRPATPGARGQRVEHSTAGHQEAWLLAQAERAGFRVPVNAASLPGTCKTARQLQLRDRYKIRFTKKDHGGVITIGRVNYEGMLDVTNPEALRSALIAGSAAHARAAADCLHWRRPDRCAGIGPPPTSWLDPPREGPASGGEPRQQRQGVDRLPSLRFCGGVTCSLVQAGGRLFENCAQSRIVAHFLAS